MTARPLTVAAVAGPVSVNACRDGRGALAEPLTSARAARRGGSETVSGYRVRGSTSRVRLPDLASPRLTR